MNKIVLIVLLALPMFLGCESNKPKERTILDLGTTYQFMPEFLNGKLREVKETLYWAKEENNKFVKGNVMSVKERDSLGIPSDFIVNFDENGILTKSIALNDGKIIDYYLIDVENGKTKKATLYVKDTIKLYILFNYDDKGFLSDLKGYSQKDQKPTFGWKITNDVKGDYTNVEYLDGKDVKTGHGDFKRDVDGKIIESKSYNDKDSLTHTRNMTYNDKGFYQSFELIDKNITKITVNYLTFDERGNWLTSIGYRNGNLLFYCERNYTYY